jgi:hypothetical protein
VTVNQTVQEQVVAASPPEPIEALDAGKFEAMRWLQMQFNWESLMDDVRSRASTASQNGSSAVAG